MAKWTQRDTQNPRRMLNGTLQEAHIFSGDGDVNVEIFPHPDAASQAVLVNRFGAKNANGIVECEIEVDDSYENAYLQKLNGFKNQPVTVIGVWVDDNDHDNKTELHPIDGIFVRRSDSNLTAHELDIKQKYAVGNMIAAYAIFLAADDSWLIYPPLSEVTRPITFGFALPPRPPVSAGHTLRPMIEPKYEVIKNTTVSAPTFNDSPTSPYFTVEFTCKADSTLDVPGTLIGEMVTFWKEELPTLNVSVTPLPMWNEQEVGVSPIVPPQTSTVTVHAMDSHTGSLVSGDVWLDNDGVK